MSTGIATGIAGLSLLAQTAQCIPFEDKTAQCLPCVAADPVDDYKYKCSLCARVVLESNKYFDYNSLRPTIIMNDTEHTKFMRHAGQHCKEKHPNCWAWNFLPNPSFTVCPKNFDTKVDFLICLSLMNGAKEYPLDHLEATYNMDYMFAAQLFNH